MKSRLLGPHFSGLSVWIWLFVSWLHVDVALLILLRNSGAMVFWGQLSRNKNTAVEEKMICMPHLWHLWCVFPKNWLGTRWSLSAHDELSVKSVKSFNENKFNSTKCLAPCSTVSTLEIQKILLSMVFSEYFLSQLFPSTVHSLKRSHLHVLERWIAW